MQRGFSLVELSIVLVILGLLTGGILAGQSLIRAAEIRAVTSETQRYTAAVNTFRDKYLALPGDMRNATTFWGILASDGADATCQNTAATGAPTCNGNGDGWINTYNVSNSERFRGWQHLANAGLVEGSYTGRTSSATDGSASCTRSTACPFSKLSDATHQLTYRGAPADSSMFVGSQQNALFFSGMSNTAVLKPEEAWNIDTKMDDGRPAYGRIYTPKNTAGYCGTCATTDVESTAEYNLSTSAKVCCLYFQL